MQMKNSCLAKIADNTNNFSSLLESIFHNIDLKDFDVSNNISNELFELIKSSKYLEDDASLVSQNQLPVIFTNLLNDFPSRISQEFQLSILSGEHYYEFAGVVLNEIQNSFIKLRESINKLASLKAKSPNLTGQINLPHFSHDAQLFINLYSRLVKFVEIDLDFSRDTVAISKAFEDIVSKEEINKIIALTPRANLPRPFLEPYFLFQLNVKVAFVDDNISCDLEKMYELITIKNYLEGDHFKYSRTLDILNDKCKYLIKKIYLSLHEKKNQLINDLDPSGTRISAYKIEDFAFFENQTNTHYINFDHNLDQSLIFSIEEAIKNNTVSLKCSFKDIHFISKYYIKVAITMHDVVTKMDLLITYFEENYLNLTSQSTFDKQAYKTTLIFLKNRKLKILYKQALNNISILQSTPLTDDTIEQKLNDCLVPFDNYFTEISPQQKSEIKNYFPFYLYCFFYNNVLATLKSISANISVSLNLIERVITNFKPVYSEALKNLKWCKEKNYMLLYLPYEECSHDVVIDKITDKKAKIFLDSSFIFPVDYAEKEKRLWECLQNFIENRTILYNSMLGLKVKKIEASIDEFKTTSTRIENKLDSQFSNHVQLLAVFAAIIAYVIGSISIIPKLPDIKSIIVFMLSFSFALSCFVLLIRTLIKEDLKKIYSTFLTFLVLLFICIYFLFYWSPSILKDSDQPPSKSDSALSKDNSEKSHSMQVPVTLPPTNKDSDSITGASAKIDKNHTPPK